MTAQKWLNVAYLIAIGVLLILHLTLDDFWAWFALVGITLPVSLCAIVITSTIAMAFVGIGLSEWIGTTILAAIWVALTCGQLWVFNRVISVKFRRNSTTEQDQK